MEQGVKTSMAKSQARIAASNDPDVVRRSSIEEKEGLEDAVKQYLNPHDRFAARMKASMGKGSGAEDGGNAEQ